MDEKFDMSSAPGIYLRKIKEMRERKGAHLCIYLLRSRARRRTGGGSQSMLADRAGWRICY